MGGHVGQIESVEDDPAARDRLEPGDHAQQRRLAATARAEQRHDLAVGHLEVDPVERGLAVEVHLDALHRQHQNSPSEPTRTRSISRTTDAVTTIRMVLSARA